MRVLVAIFAVCVLALPKFAAESPMTMAAKVFVASLDESQRAKAVFALDSSEKTNWGYVPGPRKGVSWKELTAAQKVSARELLQASLSHEGYETVEAVRGLETVLYEMENSNPTRDPERYWFMFFGSPSSEAPWVWRYEGHHVSLTFASKGDVVVSSTPQFVGSNPAEVKSGDHKGQRVLAKEQDLGFRLVESLTADQRLKAVIADVAPADIVTANSRKAAIEGRLGIAYTALDTTQQNMLRELVKTFARVQTKNEQIRRLAAVEKEGYDGLVFAWLGPVQRAARHYYRIQGKSFLIEYDNTQNDGNHIHTVWRDFNGDFGEDALAEHYAEDHR